MHDRIYRIQSVRSINSICCTPFESNIAVGDLLYTIWIEHQLGLSTSEKREILSQIKEFVEQNEKAANDVLSDNPQLAQALLLIQMEFNLVKSQDIQVLTRIIKSQISQCPHQNKQKLKIVSKGVHYL
eukprot:585830_1